MNIKTILFFVSGVIIGGVSGVFGAKKYYQEKYQKRYEEDHKALEEYYQKVDEYSRADHDDEENDVDNNLDGNEVNPILEGETSPGGRMSSEERAEIKKKLAKNWEGTTNYAGMYRTKNGYTEEKMAEGEHPSEGEKPYKEDRVCYNCANYDSEQCNCQITDEEVDANDTCEDFENVNDEPSPEEEAFEFHQKNKNKPPKIISAEAYSNLPAHIEQGVLYFYSLDEVLADENEEYIEEPEMLIGDALTKYGFIDNDESLIFVMNYATDTCYEIQKIEASWTDTH